MACGFGMTTLGGDAGGRSSWVRHLGRKIERGRMRVCESVARGSFTCEGLLGVLAGGRIGRSEFYAAIVGLCFQSYLDMIPLVCGLKF